MKKPKEEGLEDKIGQKFYMWQNGMCITYLTKFKQMENFLIKNGCVPTHNLDEADIVILGACASFLPYFDAYRERISTISPRKTVIVYGCIPIVNQKFFKDTSQNVTLFIPPRAPEKISRLFAQPKVSWEATGDSSVFRREDYTHYDSEKRFIVIQEGCNEKCIHCPHRVAIGKEKSYPKERIISKIKRDMLEEGKKTFLLEGENCGSWGHDLTPSLTYKDLLDEVLAAIGTNDIWLGNISPKWILRYGELFAHPRITDIKIPIQTTSPPLLSLMGRDPCVLEMSPILKKLRKANKRLTLRTEIIIGYPTSTEEELTETLEFVSEHFNKVACFSFDFHPHTEIAKRNLPFLPDAVSRDRVRKAIEFFSTKPDIAAAFDDRGKICAQVTGKKSVLQ